jgi:hypothetical protein
VILIPEIPWPTRGVEDAKNHDAALERKKNAEMGTDRHQAILCPYQMPLTTNRAPHARNAPGVS